MGHPYSDFVLLFLFCCVFWSKWTRLVSQTASFNGTKELLRFVLGKPTQRHKPIKLFLPKVGIFTAPQGQEGTDNFSSSVSGPVCFTPGPEWEGQPLQGAGAHEVRSRLLRFQVIANHNHVLLVFLGPNRSHQTVFPLYHLPTFQAVIPFPCQTLSFPG